MSQISFSEAEYDQKRRKTRREKFLEQMDTLIPWKKLEKKIVRHYPKNGQGRQPYPLSTMLRIHCMQLFYNLSDPAMEDSLYEIESMRRFCGLRLSDRLPDETTILNFRHLLERHNLGKKLFDEINRHLSSQGLSLREGSIVDATIISAPRSTKNKEGARDPDMHQVKKGNEWYFGMKMHIGVDDALGLIHSVTTTSANVHDITQAGQLLHGEEERVWGDAGYVGIEKREEHEERDVDWFIALRPGKRRALLAKSDEAETEYIKAQVRAKVEHPFRYIKRVFGYDKVRYRGLEKNSERLHLLAAFTNLMIGKKYLLA
ncbi:MAG: IS5 family transposase [Gammaproteobacteria bacterium]|nr:IS5 family transposase [Gammaproteobacteria bacterium]